MKKSAVIKGIINYIFAMIFAIIFALFLDANVGWFILLTLILAPLLSVFFAWLSSRMITVSCQMEDALLSKGDTCNMQVEVRNKSIFPTPPIAISLTNEAGVRSDEQDLLVSVLSRGTQTFEIIFKAKICGRSMVGIENVRVTDYLGIFSFGVKDLDYSSWQKKVAVIPDIAELSARDDNLLKVMQSSLHMDDSEDTVDSHAYSFGGFPGYDNRDYVPGDPLKRINWKQSAKRNKLLVRLDDEMAARAVNVVLDSVFEKGKIDVQGVTQLHQYRFLDKDEILPKIAEDAVENALGMMQVLIRHSYTVNFYVRMNGSFSRYEIQDEIDLETVRLELADYYFATGEGVERIPMEDAGFAEKVGLFSTPNSYEDVYAVLDSAGVNVYTTIYAVLEEARKQNNADSSISLENIGEKKKEKRSVREKIVSAAKSLIIPYFLGFLLSTIVFSVFDVPFRSHWTLVQAAVCLAVVVYCEYIKEHKVIGTMLTTLLVLGIFNVAARQAFSGGLLNYMHWFMSGGESVETTNAYLLSILLIFTTFFSMVTYYFIRILYRTSFLLLVSLIPFVVYVKVMLDIQVAQVVFVTVLNVAAFLIHYRTIKDKGKRIVGYVEGLVSLGIFAAIFVLIGLAVPETETKYYYMFENAFLGGNVSEKVPEEYSEMSEYSGNADGFNELNDRKLYVIRLAEPGVDLYLNRQTFDLYDFKNDRWYPIDYYSEAVYTTYQWAEGQRGKNLSSLIDAMNQAQKYEPDILDRYDVSGIGGIKNIQTDARTLYTIETTNFPSVGYVTPPGTVYVSTIEDEEGDQDSTYVTRAGVFRRQEGFLQANLKYSVEFYDEGNLRNLFMVAGGTNQDMETSLQMLTEIREILDMHGEAELAETVSLFLQEAREAQAYQAACAENTAQIPEKVKELALEITDDCTYDWEKAVALQTYFRENGFVYDLSYKAPDDSVEYFLFRGKTGTCSDYASAYTLMARAVGLTVRYVEGFVPDEEYNGDYVVRTNCGHAYPEVYIPNVGYVVFEATIPASYNVTRRGGSGITSYLMRVALQLVLVFAGVSAVIVCILFIHLIAAPYLKERIFLGRVKRAAPNRAVIMLYRRIQKKYTQDVIQNAGPSTPYEYAEEFEQIYHHDICELSLLVEKAAYTQEALSEAEKIRAQQLYHQVREMLKQRRTRKKQLI